MGLGHGHLNAGGRSRVRRRILLCRIQGGAAAHDAL